MAPPGSGISLLRLPAVIERVGIRRSAIYAAIAAGTFPKPINISRRAVAWRSDEIVTWINNIIERESPKCPHSQ